MKRIVFYKSARWVAFAAFLTLTTTADAMPDWSALWRTPDQRGEQLLRQGDPEAAAKIYADPRRKAYAELKAGDLKEAAHDYSAFDDGDAHYNRGNALARSGDLQQAIKAYEEALKRDPNNQDAKHNRDLVAEALKKQQEQQKKSPSDQKKQESKDGKDSDEPKDGKNGNSGSGEKDKPSGSQSAAGGKEPSDSQSDQQNPAQDQQSKAGDESQQAKQDVQKTARQQAQADGQKDGRSDGQKDGPKDAQKEEQKDQAQPAAQAKAGGPDQSGSGNQRTGDAGESTQQKKAAGKGQAELSEPPSTEQQLAEQQWLRRIPDDPGGLLRRKFLIEHLMREQQQQQAQP